MNVEPDTYIKVQLQWSVKLRVKQSLLTSSLITSVITKEVLSFPFLA